MFVCVCEREKKREKEREGETEKEGETERDREKDREKDGERGEGERERKQEREIAQNFVDYREGFSSIQKLKHSFLIFEIKIGTTHHKTRLGRLTFKRKFSTVDLLFKLARCVIKILKWQA